MNFYSFRPFTLKSKWSFLCTYSQVAKTLDCNSKTVGSNPTMCLGSVGQVDKSSLFQGGIMGSIPIQSIYTSIVQIVEHHLHTVKGKSASLFTGTLIYLFQIWEVS